MWAASARAAGFGQWLSLDLPSLQLSANGKKASKDHGQTMNSALVKTVFSFDFFNWRYEQKLHGLFDQDQHPMSYGHLLR